MCRRLLILGLLTLGVLASVATEAVPSLDAGYPLACLELVQKACGAQGECEDNAWCEAAHTLQDREFDGRRCQRALEEPEQFPLCELHADTLSPERVLPFGCEALLDHVCGVADAQGVRPCGDGDACANARLLTTASAPADAGSSVEDSGSGVDAGDLEAALAAQCDAALQESALFPRCAP